MKEKRKTFSQNWNSMFKFDSFIKLCKTGTFICVIYDYGNGEMMGREERIAIFSKCLFFKTRQKSISPDQRYTRLFTHLV